MTLTDIILLAKQGFTAKDIKELTKEPVAETNPTEVPTEPQPIEEVKESEKVKELEVEEVEPVIDYKKLYEEEHEKLVQAQKVNTNIRIAKNETSVDETLTEILENYF